MEPADRPSRSLFEDDCIASFTEELSKTSTRRWADTTATNRRHSDVTRSTVMRLTLRS